MLGHSKEMRAIIPVYRVIWLMEERGLRKDLARRKVNLSPSVFNRHIYNLYRLRRGMLVQLGSEKYFGFGKPTKFTKGKKNEV